MPERVLVAYATKYGSTTGIARRIGEVLSSHALDVDVQLVRPDLRIAGYGSVILGSSVYIGRARKEARIFLRSNEQALASMPVWLFSSGPTDDSEFDERLDGWHVPGWVKETVDRIAPRDRIVFGGAMDPGKMSGLERWIIRRIGAATADVRDWDRISAWAEKVAAEIERE